MPPPCDQQTIKYTRRGTILLEALRFEVTVADTGIGIWKARP
jgi:hypothetical protein